MNLKKFMEEGAVSPKELAEIFECSPSNVSNIANGKRNLTKYQMRRLIENYGFDKIAQYAFADEMPSRTLVEVNAPVIAGNEGPVQAGNGNSMELPPDAGIVEVLRQQSNQISTLLSQQQTMLAHQERLIALLEKK